MKEAIQIVCVAVIVVGLGSMAVAKVTIDTVRVGNVGNTGEWSGQGYDGGNGKPGICGAVDYEYNIGKYEVTAGQYTEFLNAVAATDTYWLYSTYMSWEQGCRIQQSGSSGGYSYSVAADWANRPVNYVSWYDALRFANWMTAGDTESGSYTITSGGPNSGMVTIPTAVQRALWANGSNRYVLLTSEDEWYKAAYYDPSLNAGAGGYYDYPTSSDSAPGYINNSGDFSRTGDGSFSEGGTDPGNYATYDGDRGWEYRTVVGEHENSGSPYGTFDQGGSVWEWNEAIMFTSHPTLYRGIRGGSFNYNSVDYLHASYRAQRSEQNEGDGFGFRISVVPEPATLSMLALGGLAIQRRRKRGMCK